MQRGTLQEHPGITRFESIKKDRKKLTDHNEIIKLIQDIEALDSIRKKIMQEDEKHRCEHKEKNNNARGKSEDANNKHSNNHGHHNKPSDGRTENSNLGDKPCRSPRHDHKWRDCPNNLCNKSIKKEDKKTKDDK